MKIRNHPQMIRKNGFRAWPPLWTTTHHNKDDKPIGEVGYLEDVMMSDLIGDKIFLFMRHKDSRYHESLRYMGFMCFDDARICSEIYVFLKSKIGLSIKEIGALDLSEQTGESSPPNLA